MIASVKGFVSFVTEWSKQHSDLFRHGLSTSDRAERGQSKHFWSLPSISSSPSNYCTRPIHSFSTDLPLTEMSTDMPEISQKDIQFFIACLSCNADPMKIDFHAAAEKNAITLARNWWATPILISSSSLWESHWFVSKWQSRPVEIWSHFTLGPRRLVWKPADPTWIFPTLNSSCSFVILPSTTSTSNMAREEEDILANKNAALLIATLSTVAEFNPDYHKVAEKMGISHARTAWILTLPFTVICWMPQASEV